jgi:hypothetical protein
MEQLSFMWFVLVLPQYLLAGFLMMIGFLLIGWIISLFIKTLFLDKGL